MLVYVYLLLCTITFILTQEKPSILYFSKDQVKTVGDSMDLECSVNNVGNLLVRWSRHNFDKYYFTIPLNYGQTKVMVDPRFSFTYIQQNNTYWIHVSDIQESDAGLYKCQIINDYDVTVVSRTKYQKISLIITIE